MKNFKQRDATDCGVMCLSFILDHYGSRVSPTLLRQRAGTDRIGTTALGLVEAAKAFDLTAKGIKCKPEHVNKLVLPAIAHIKIEREQSHYVVICGRSGRGITVMDPRLGRTRVWREEEFSRVWTNVVVIMSPGGAFQKREPGVSAVKRLGGWLWKQKHIVGQSLIGAALGTILSLSSAAYVQKIVDNVILDGNRALLNLLGVAMLSILALRLVLSVLQQLLLARAAQQIDAGLIMGYYRHLLYLPQSFFDTMRVGDINSRIGDAMQIRSFINGSFASLILNPLILIFALGSLFVYSWKLALLSLALIPLNLGVYLAADCLNKRYQRTILERSADFGAQVIESLQSMGLVRILQLQRATALRIEKSLVRLFDVGWSATYSGIFLGVAATLITGLYGIALLWVGATLVLQSQITLGELMSCYTLSNYLTGPISGLIGINATIRQTLISIDRMYEIMDLECEPDTGLAVPTPGQPLRVRFQDVMMKYPGRIACLSTINLCFLPGKITLLAGPSGCGKSTIFNLILRTQQPTAGRIYVNELNISEVRLAEWRQSVAYLPQKVEIMAASLLENLVPGVSEPDVCRLVRICQDVGLIPFIESLPEGFATLITEGGANLSGGQRQRIGIVRALYRDAPILLLDEPNSCLDKPADILLMDVILRERAKNKTIIIAAHSQRTLKIADNYVELDMGQIRKEISREGVPGARAISVEMVDQAAVSAS